MTPPTNVPSAPAWLSFPVRRPGAALAFSLLATVVMAVGAAFLHTSKDIRVFFNPDDPQLQAYDALENTYSESNSVVFVVARRDDGTIFSRQALAALQALTDRAWLMPFCRRVDSLTNYQHSRADGDDLIVGDLVAPPASELTDGQLAEIERRAMANPLLVGRLVSADGKVGAANAPVILPGLDALSEQPAVARYARRLAAEIEAEFPAMRVYLTGIVMINQALDDAIDADASSLVPLMFLLILLCLAVLLRAVSASLAAFAVILCAIASAFGMAGWIGITMSPTVLSAVNMIMTLAVADSVHILMGFRDRCARSGDKRAAMVSSLASNFRPVFLTSFTTVLGFLSLNTSDSPPFRDLGNVVAIGVAAAWVFVHTLLPAIMVLVPGQPRAGSADHGAAWTRWLAELSIRRTRWVLFGGLTASVLLGSFLTRNELNDEFLMYFDDQTPFRVATDFTIERLTGFEYIDYSLESGEPGGIAEPEYLREVEAFADWFRTQPKVRHVYAITDLIKRLNKDLHGGDPASHAIPASRQVAADCLMLYELSLPFGLDLTDQIDISRSATLFKVSVANITSNELQSLDRDAQTWLREHGLSAGSAGTGQSMMFAHIGPRNIESLLGGTVAALLLISLCMVLITRSIKFGLASLLPNLAPAAIGFGIWGLTVGQVGLALSVVVGMTLGIVVDDSIHFITKYLAARAEGSSPAAAIRRTFDAVASAMVTTTITLVLGFGILTFSGFELNSGMGLLSSMVIAIALVFDLLVLPALLLVLDRDATGRAPIPES